MDFSYDSDNESASRVTDWLGAGLLFGDELFDCGDGVYRYDDCGSAGELETRYIYGPGIDPIIGRVDDGGDVDEYLSDLFGS